MSDQLIDEQIAEFRETFKIFDEDGDNMLSERELGTLLNALGTHPTESDLTHMFREVNREQEGMIDFPDFLSLMARKMKDSDAEEELIEAFKVVRSCLVSGLSGFYLGSPHGLGLFGQR